MRKISILLCGMSFLACVLAVNLIVTCSCAAELAPNWWSDRGVLTTDAASDYAALNMGQLKNLAYMAWLELETLPGGAGFEPSFTNTDCNYAAVNIGQLKEIARPFYDRLGLQGQYPWSEVVTSNDFNIANIGQAKYLFSFSPSCIGDLDQDGMPDQWEIANGFDLYGNEDASADADGDGLSNLDEYLLGTEPRSANFFSQPETPVSSQRFGSGLTGLLILTPSVLVH